MAKKELGKHEVEVGEVFNIQIKSGNGTQFWRDKWRGTVKLKDKYPSLYELELGKSCSVSSSPQDAGFSRDLGNLHRDMYQITMENGDDRWMCPLNSRGEYTVKGLIMKIDSRMCLPSGNTTFKWCKEVPLKVNCFVWRASQRRLPLQLPFHLKVYH